MIPAYIEARIRREPPVDAHVVPSSTPVVAFGDARIARVATLGLNPSRVEFNDKAGVLLTGTKRRLATHASLGVSDLGTAPSDAILQVLDDCNRYFQRQPYRQWFDQLEIVLRACGASYYDETACHLDLVQWATDPVWGKLQPPVRKKLIADDAAFLADQLRNENIRLLLVNGMSVWKQLQAALSRELIIEGEAVVGVDSYQPACLYYGSLFNKVQVVAWSTNLQSSFGVTTLFREELARRVAGVV